MKSSQSKYIILLIPHYFKHSDLSMGSDPFRVCSGLVDQSDAAYFFIGTLDTRALLPTYLFKTSPAFSSTPLSSIIQQHCHSTTNYNEFATTALLSSSINQSQDPCEAGNKVSITQFGALSLPELAKPHGD